MQDKIAINEMLPTQEGADSLVGNIFTPEGMHHQQQEVDSITTELLDGLIGELQQLNPELDFSSADYKTIADVINKYIAGII